MRGSNKKVLTGKFLVFCIGDYTWGLFCTTKQKAILYFRGPQVYRIIVTVNCSLTR